MLDFHNTLIKPATPSPRELENSTHKHYKQEYLTSRSEVQLNRTFKFKNGQEWTTTPIIMANMATVGKSSLCNNEDVVNNNISIALHKYHTPLEIIKIPYCVSKETVSKETPLNNFWITFGLQDSFGVKDVTDLQLRHKCRYTEENALWNLLNREGTKICLDVANGYLNCFVKKVQYFRKLFPKAIIMAGNIATAQGAVALATAGADIIKIGIGPGALCTTRQVTGVGYPQLQAIQEISRSLRERVCECECESVDGNKVYLCADGGISVPGDACKAFVAGADFVMLGSYFLGCSELGVKGYGMASSEALMKHGFDMEYRAAEGRSIEVEPKGPLRGLLKQLLGGIRSCCTYTDSHCIEELKNAQLVKVS